MTRHLTRRAPKRSGGFSWGRFPTSDSALITWRMFRRDHTRALHTHALTFTARDDAAYVAKQLRRARRQLRDRVDEIDLAAMGVAA
ncbi:MULTISPECIES: hypothetical protein [Xanthomonas]|uniref:Uncharacterized protein n=1 Tax=Xanthomonas dyei TaxID=743699 RepID=A0ABZ0DAS5_9XANT|nr:hypothetical protein [Xanthomonas dyei]WOB24785.1 hypothetical protein NYR99_13345 [Xanthomonas dyei]WOB52413.1 hypothetical protein NYR95_13350 [Xanthomonas dyei]